MPEKAELLDELSSSYQEIEELDVNFLVVTILSMVIVLMLIFPKIYISSNIYYESIKIGKLKKELKTLTDENKNLVQKIEHKRFMDE